MAKSTSFMLPQNANTASVTLTSANTTTPVTCFTAGANDSDVKSILCATNDTTAVNLQLYVTRGGTDYLVGTISIPIASGTNGSANTIDILNAVALAGLPLDAVGKAYLPLKTGDTLKVGCLATMTAAKTTWVNIFGQDY